MSIGTLSCVSSPAFWHHKPFLQFVNPLLVISGRRALAGNRGGFLFSGAIAFGELENFPSYG